MKFYVLFENLNGIFIKAKILLEKPFLQILPFDTAKFVIMLGLMFL